ncbi:MAG: hypothetical protein P8M07_07710, partial [Flavobacteriales bacterium]|nr:hypothetical protein [Flavobacteriales bacterium]
MNSLLRAAYTTALALGITISTFAQSYGVRTELHAENIGVLTNALGETTDLTGFNTYRLYATTVNSADFVSAVYGNSESPLSINTTTSYFHSSFAGLTSAGSNPLLVSVYPDVAYDSYVTIGLAGPADLLSGEADPQMATSPSQNFGAIFDPGAGAAGANLVIDDLVGGTWFVLNTAVNGTAGADLEVLIGQFTTDGDFSGTVNVQVFENGAGGTNLFITDTFEYAEGCAADVDDDGICDDEDDCVGTLDACEVCNGPGAVYDCGCTDMPAGDCDCDGNVDDALGVCGGDCAADADDDGICDDEDDCVGALDACDV